MVRAADEIPLDAKHNNSSPMKPRLPILSKSELIGNSFIFFLAGHETTANSIHFSIIFLAIHLNAQRKMQADIDSIIGREKPISEISYSADMPRLYNSMVGAVLNEQLRILPAAVGIPKITVGDQVVTIDGREFVIPDRTCIQLNVIGTNTNPKYWPSAPSEITPGTDDLDEFVPERWLRSQHDMKPEDNATEKAESNVAEELEQASFDTTTTGSLFKPIKGSFLTFSDGPRSCPGKRFTQVEMTAVLTAIFQRYSVELDVSDWTTDEELEPMDFEERKKVYKRAVESAEKVIGNVEQLTITLQMRKGEYVPLRFVERGKERFVGIS